MKKQDFKIRTKIIQETFNDKRKIKCLTPEDDRKVDENTYPGGDIFTTENGACYIGSSISLYARVISYFMPPYGHP